MSVLHSKLDRTRSGDIDHSIGSFPIRREFIQTDLILDLPKDEVTYEQSLLPHLMVVIASETLLILGNLN